MALVRAFGVRHGGLWPGKHGGTMRQYGRRRGVRRRARRWDWMAPVRRWWRRNGTHHRQRRWTRP
ncbi:hypothetical protein ACFQHO_02705 [Actinomadura yumaensis]|uniref:hypothetical protein n=1 Tax=Actinomadura yumaensis TaxID=111807 RepID=UPI003622E2F4